MRNEEDGWFVKECKGRLQEVRRRRPKEGPRGWWGACLGSSVVGKVFWRQADGGSLELNFRLNPGREQRTNKRVWPGRLNYLSRYLVVRRRGWFSEIGYSHPRNRMVCRYTTHSPMANSNTHHNSLSPSHTHTDITNSHTQTQYTQTQRPNAPRPSAPKPNVPMRVYELTMAVWSLFIVISEVCTGVPSALTVANIRYRILSLWQESMVCVTT